MGLVVAKGADYGVITSDNPRSEDPMRIIGQIVEGYSEAGSTAYEVSPDREQAIERALRRAGEGDTVLIAGKGHEDYQLIGDRRIHFDDRLVAEGVLARMGHGRGPSERD